MRLCYLLLSPTFGMHQYTAYLANRMEAAGHEVTLVTTSNLPPGRYAPNVKIVTPIHTNNTGFSREGLNFGQQDLVQAAVIDAAPDVLHFTGPHLWNINLVRRFKRLGYPVIHTIHDLVPHSGMRMGSLLGFWNRLIIREADHILVHGELYRQMLLQRGDAAEKVTFTPLLHLFVGYELEAELADTIGRDGQVSYEPFALFFGRLEKYKGIADLLAAFAQMEPIKKNGFELVLAGPGNVEPFWTGNLPTNVTIIDELIGDDEAVDLFRRCSLVVLPYTDATQSALVAAAYFFNKPVIVSHSGALAEYVVDGETGFTIEAGYLPSLVRKLTLALSSPEKLQLMGQAGRDWYEKEQIQEMETMQKLYASYKMR